MIRSLKASHKLRNQFNLHSLQHLPLSFPFNLDQQNEKKLTFSTRNYSITARNENALIIGGIGILAVAGGLHVGLSLYNQYQQKKSTAPPTDEQTESTTSATEDKSKVDETATKASSTNANEAKDQMKTEKKAEESSGSGFFGNFFATTFYDGGFEDKMTKREAALILGVRESASLERIKDAHRRILINNHPDRGGSPYIAAKVNEAKDFLLKGKPTM